MEKLINEYLDFVRSCDINYNKDKLIKVKINKFIDDNIINYYKKMHLMINYKFLIKENIEISINKLAIDRALKNLINNAFRYAKNVYMNIELVNNNILIEIEDDGPGIPKKDRENVFKPFFRLDESRNLDKSSQYQGSGLGMAIALDAITSHGGKIDLDDSQLYGGLKIIISLPI